MNIPCLIPWGELRTSDLFCKYCNDEIFTWKASLESSISKGESDFFSDQKVSVECLGIPLLPPEKI